MMQYPYSSIWLRRFALAALLCIPLLACKMTNDNLPRNQDLPLFNPHRPDFICAVESTKVPTVDAQADAWFIDARALEDPLIYEGDRDYGKIVNLTRQAADRHHWKAMLNLASLYLENRDPPHGVEDALNLVEDAMRLGIPAAYDRMGTYYMNGTGVNGDITKAYAFFQKAADMGNPQAMTFLGEKMNATWDSPTDGFWANIPIATKMLECAFAQGDGQAAMNLYYIYQETKTAEARASAVKILHEGIKLGCANCARRLFVEFGSPANMADILVPHVDQSRAERYGIFNDSLSFNPSRRYPNLDQVLPLPPAKLPPWNGDKKTLLDAAKGVSPPVSTPTPGPAAQYKGRHFVAAEFTLRPTSVKTAATHAPAPAYWQPASCGQDAAVHSLLARVPPGLYLMGEPFERFRQPDGSGGLIADVIWQRWDTIRHNHAAVDPQAAPGITRAAPRPEPLTACAKDLCPATGVWQPWLPDDHPLNSIVNQHLRQAWLTAGQTFPQAGTDWLLDLAADELTWHLMDDIGVDIG